MGKNLGKFRTLKHVEYNVTPVEFPPSIVDDSEYEDINVLVARLCRGESVPTVPVEYDGTGSVDQLIANQSPFEKDGADLSDVGPVLDGLRSRQESSKAVPLPSPAGAAETPPIAAPEAPTDANK